MTTPNPSTVNATTPQLLKATAVALAVAGVVLVTTILPAEYGVDPTGIGQALGLTALSASAETTGPAAAPTPDMAVTRSEGPYQNSEMSLTLGSNEGAEIKSLMQAGQVMVFSWQTDGGPVHVDMHGERPNAGEDFSSYWRDRDQTGGNGSFTAPFDGTHGWYWVNKGSEPVTVTVNVSGYFGALYRPE